MITVEVQGHGKFVIAANRLDELLKWLTRNSMPVEGNIRSLHDDETLLNE